MHSLALPHGTFRRLWQADMHALREHLLRLDPESRCERFGMAASDDFVNRYAELCFELDDVIYGWFDAEGFLRAAGELRGLGEGLSLGSNGAAEAAFSVELCWRRRGIGSELMARIVRAARNCGAERLYMACLARNSAMRRLADKFSAEMSFDAEDKAAARRRTAISRAQFWRKRTGGAMHHATAVLDLERRTFRMRRP